jgi:hypothetical protein
MAALLHWQLAIEVWLVTREKEILIDELTGDNLSHNNTKAAIC